MKGVVVLEDGMCFWGRAFGAMKEVCGEVVFNTSMVGYQEILTDPSYTGQLVTMTYPLIGNYGVNTEDIESTHPYVEGFIVKEYSEIVSNYRSTQSLGEYLKAYGIPGIEGIDTRQLTKHIRLRGAMRGIMSCGEHSDIDDLRKKVLASPQMEGQDLARKVSTHQAYVWDEEGIQSMPWGMNQTVGYTMPSLQYTVVALDFGIKRNILRILRNRGCRVIVVPCTETAEAILARKPDGVFLSNGPGDPAAVSYAIQTVRALLGRIPIFGICLGHQIMGLAFGARTFKLKFGHHGGNQPVQYMSSGCVAITAQNHGFAVTEETLPHNDVEITHINLNDKTIEGIRHKKYPCFSVQYHPEASPGPHDANRDFDQFINNMKVFRDTSR